MAMALNDCFGPDDVLTYDTIEYSLNAIGPIYEELELKFLANKMAEMDLANSVPNGETQETNGHLNEYERKLKELENENLIVSSKGEII